ncbi:MAG: cyclic nucleotide-binding domain-containing protein [Lachnospiraceae bacterium]
MAAVTYAKEKHLYKNGDKMREIGLIVQGSVRRISKNSEIILESGNLIGLAGCASCTYIGDYVTAEETVIYGFPYRTTEDLKTIFETQKNYGSVFLLAAVKQTHKTLEAYSKLRETVRSYYKLLADIYRDYKYLCLKYKLPEKPFPRMDLVTPMEFTGSIPEWQLEFYDSLNQFPLEELKKLYPEDALNIGTIFNSGAVMQEAIWWIDEMQDYLVTNKEVLLSEDRNDLFMLVFDLVGRAFHKEENYELVGELMDLMIDFLDHHQLYDKETTRTRISEYINYNFNKGKILEELESMDTQVDEMQALMPQLEGEECLSYILDYAGCEEEQAKEFKGKLTAYRELPDIFSTDEPVRRLRNYLAQSFYGFYKVALKKAFEETKIPPLIQMFLNFGFMDAEMAGEEVTNSLLALTEKLFLCTQENVYTMYSWLESIYNGTNEPSLSEFDLDFTAYLKDGIRSGSFTKEEAAAMQKDQWAKVEFEIDNMFISTNKVTFGRVTTFCPILNECDIISSVEKMFVTEQRVNEAIDNVREVDYGLFFREVMFFDEAHGIPREYINQEVLPNVILLPNAGSKGMMWQVTGDKRNNTAARFMIPIFTIADLSDLMIENAGRYRWEMCRKVQGARWNDITDPSLTAEYSDYLQYYRKNSEISPEAKERIRNALVKGKNNYREVFVRDYENWIKYEAKGSVRLNKAAREILFRYCPFTVKVREALNDNPMYRDMFERYQILNGRKIKRLETLYERYSKNGGEITPQLQENMDYYHL